MPKARIYRPPQRNLLVTRAALNISKCDLNLKAQRNEIRNESLIPYMWLASINQISEQEMRTTVENFPHNRILTLRPLSSPWFMPEKIKPTWRLYQLSHQIHSLDELYPGDTKSPKCTSGKPHYAAWTSKFHPSIAKGSSKMLPTLLTKQRTIREEYV